VTDRTSGALAGRLGRVLPLVGLFAAWQLLAATGVLSPKLLPSFAAVVRALAGLLISGEILPHTLASLARAGAGFGVAVAGGVVLGVLMARVPVVERTVEPVLLLVYPVPKPALIPLFMIWLGIGDFSKITVIALAAALPVIVAAHNGARGVDDVLVWSARSRGTSEARILWRIVLPAALPQIAAGVRTALAVAMIVLVSSEFISSEAGLGYLIFSYGGVGAEDAMLAVVLYLALLGYGGDRLYVAALRRLLAWHEWSRA